MDKLIIKSESSVQETSTSMEQNKSKNISCVPIKIEREWILVPTKEDERENEEEMSCSDIVWIDKELYTDFLSKDERRYNKTRDDIVSDVEKELYINFEWKLSRNYGGYEWEDYYTKVSEYFDCKSIPKNKKINILYFDKRKEKVDSNNLTLDERFVEQREKNRLSSNSEINN